MDKDNITTFLAVWGAIVSTIVLVWDVYKWRRTGHPKLIIRASGNLRDAHSNNSQKYISVKVTNIGDKPTTIGLITYRYYKTKPGKWRRQWPEQRGFFNKPMNASAELPYKLEVGAEWSCLAVQTKEIEEMARNGYLYFEVEDTSTSNALAFSKTRFLVDS